MESGQRSIHTYLIKRSRSGDREAQNELYKAYAQAMYQICRRMMGNDEDAKDVLQDAFVHAFVKLNTLRNDNLFTAWLKRIVVNHCLNALKAQKQLQLEVEEYETEELDEAYNKIRVQQVLRALDQISPGCRTVLNLYVFEGYDHGEIAQILNISVSASKAQYSKAKSKIRSLLNTDKKNGTGFI